MVRIKSVLAIFILLLVDFTFASWRENIDNLLKTDNPEKQSQLINKIIKTRPNWHEVYGYLHDIEFKKADTSGLILREAACIDGVIRPYVIYVPESYDNTEPTPLFICLHGSVSRPEIRENPLGYAEENGFLKIGRENGWFMIYPFGQWGATWWDEVGMANIANLIRTAKREFNIDDDRVYLGGFSDGSSASFLHAMVAPSDYAAFIALNGHMGVGSEDAGLHIYAPNMANTPIYAVTTFSDRLYPSDMMRPTIEMAQRAGGDIFYREFEGTHTFDYADTELPLIVDFMNRHPRDPFPSNIIWETADLQFGQCRWLQINKISTEPLEPWHVDYNTPMVDSSISIGFMSDDNFKGDGVKVGVIIDADNIANRSRLQEGDVIIKGNTMPVKNLDDLIAFKASISHGQAISLTVIRNDNEVVLHANVPEPRLSNLFHRAKPAGRINARFGGNRIDIEASRVAECAIFIHPDMIKLENGLKITVNGEMVYESRIIPDIDFMLNNFLANRDRNLIYIARVNLIL